MWITAAIQYSVATFKKLFDFTGEQLANVKKYADDFRAQIKDMIQQRAADTINRAEPDAVYDDGARYRTSEDGEHFVISSNDIIDGERDDLPL